jgi:hypothetical protein
MNSMAHGRTGLTADRFAAAPVRPVRSLGIIAAFFGVAALAGWYSNPLPRSDTMDPVELAQRCRDWDAAALAAMERRANGPEVGKQVYLRMAMTWLAEGRRSCELGSDLRAERFYRRIVGRVVTQSPAGTTQAAAGR